MQPIQVESQMPGMMDFITILNISRVFQMACNPADKHEDDSKSLDHFLRKNSSEDHP